MLKIFVVGMLLIASFANADEQVSRPVPQTPACNGDIFVCRQKEIGCELAQGLIAQAQVFRALSNDPEALNRLAVASLLCPSQQTTELIMSFGKKE